MADETAESGGGFGATVRAFAFDGDEVKYRSWEGKTLALASSKGFLLALTRESTGTVLTVEEFEYGQVEVTPATAATTGGVAGTAAVMRPTTAAENRKYLARAAAWTYLVASCTDKAYALIERCEGDPFMAWSILQEKYCATDAEENYPELDQAFSECKLAGTQKDPELWFNDMDHLNMRLPRINLKYKKDELQMKSHMMSAMSNDYESVIVKFRGDLNDTTLVKLRKEVVLQYKSLIKASGGKTTSESVLAAPTSKTPWKKFKGTCRNCGKIGHKAHECRSNKVESADEATKDSGTSKGDKSHVTCYNCQQKGHFANKCPNPKKAKSEETDDMNLFVGVTFADGPTDSKTTEEYVGSASKTGLAEEWLLDSGATCGVTYDNTHMTDMKPSDREITIGNGDKVATKGQGTVMLTDKHGQTVKLTDVYYAPTFKKNIVSMRKLIDDKWTFHMADKTAFVFMDPATKGTVKFGRKDKDMLYYLSGTRNVDHANNPLALSLTTAPVTLDINIAHGLLGHPDTKTVTAMAKEHGWTLTGSVQPCGSCALAKARAKAIPKSTMTKATKPRERLFLDISGPYSDSLNQNKYWLKIVDDYTRYTQLGLFPTTEEWYSSSAVEVDSNEQGCWESMQVSPLRQCRRK